MSEKSKTTRLEGGRSEESDRRLKAVEAVIRDLDPVLIGWLTKKFGEGAIARDIAQDAYLRVWRFAHESEIADPKALIFKAAANLAANEFKARRRFRATHVDVSGPTMANHMEAIPAEAPSPERAECARQDWEACRKAIAALPEKARRAFILSRFEELTYREIAQRLSVSESSVEKYIILALKSLRKSAFSAESEAKVLMFAGRGQKDLGRTPKIKVR